MHTHVTAAGSSVCIHYCIAGIRKKGVLYLEKSVLNGGGWRLSSDWASTLYRPDQPNFILGSPGGLGNSFLARLSRGRKVCPHTSLTAAFFLEVTGLRDPWGAVGLWCQCIATRPRPWLLLASRIRSCMKLEERRKWNTAATNTAQTLQHSGHILVRVVQL